MMQIQDRDTEIGIGRRYGFVQNFLFMVYSGLRGPLFLNMKIATFEVFNFCTSSAALIFYHSRLLWYNFVLPTNYFRLGLTLRLPIFLLISVHLSQ